MNSGDSARVAVLGLGGTIAMVPGLNGGIVPAVWPENILATVPGLAETGIAVESAELACLASPSLTFDDVTRAQVAVEKVISDGCCGAVITQGTDTMEEMAYALDLRHTGSQPVVLTGAMRSSAAAGSDGPANLLAALTVAADPAARNRGVMVVMADQVHAARHVAKTHTSSLAAFSSPGLSPLGRIIEGRPRFDCGAGTRFTIPVPEINPKPRVCLLTVFLDDDGFLLDAIDDRVHGLVIAGTGGGHVPAPLVSKLAELAAQMPVVLTTRVPAGPAMSSTYGYPGSELDLLPRGLIGAGFLSSLKARILLRGLLAVGASRDMIAAAFGAAGGLDDSASWPWSCDSNAIRPE